MKLRIKRVLKEAPEKPVQKLSFEENPIEFILIKYPSVKATLTMLMSSAFKDYINGIYVVAPRPTTFKVLLHNNQEFFLIWTGKTYICKVEGKKYYLTFLSDKQRATGAIAQLLELGAPIGKPGPESEEENDPESYDDGEGGGDEELPDESAPDEEAPEEVLEETIKKKDKFLRETPEEVQSELSRIGYKDTKKISSKRVKLFVPNSNRNSTIEDITDKLKYSFDTDIRGSSMGGLRSKDGTIVLVKPKEKQGGKTAGLDNEDFFANKINSIVSKTSPADITIKDKHGKKVAYKNITSAKKVGYKFTGGLKADIQLLSKEGVVANISLKKANAVIWESSDSRHREVVLKLIEAIKKGKLKDVSLQKTDKKDIYRLYNIKEKRNYSGIIVTDLKTDDVEEIVFGKDNPKTVVIRQTFLDNDFKTDKKNITIAVESIIKDMADVENTPDTPILVIRHDSTRHSTSGLRPIVHTKKFAYDGDTLRYRNMKEISYSKIK